MSLQRITISLATVRDTLTNAYQVEAIARDLADGGGVTGEHVARAVAILGEQHSRPVVPHVEDRPSRFVPRRALPPRFFEEAAR